MENQLNNHSHYSKRVQIDCSGEKHGYKTDQSDLKKSDINNIMKSYAKSGLLPVQQDKVAQYIDNTLVMPLEDAHALMSEAKSLFNALPPQIRKLMDNDPRKLESFLKDENNHPILEQYKVINKKPLEEVKKVEPNPSADPAAANVIDPAQGV